MQKRRSRWREYLLLYRELLRAIIPTIGLRRVLRSWRKLRRLLADSPRKRQRAALS